MSVPRIVGLAFATVFLGQFAVAQNSPPASQMDEYRDSGDGGHFKGPVDQIAADGPDWSGVFHDATNGTARDVTISIDDSTKTMIIRETGTHGPIQIWTGTYRVDDGNIYKMKGKLTEQDSAAPTEAFDILATLVLP